MDRISSILYKMCFGSISATLGVVVILFFHFPEEVKSWIMVLLVFFMFITVVTAFFINRYDPDAGQFTKLFRRGDEEIQGILKYLYRGFLLMMIVLLVLMQFY